MSTDLRISNVNIWVFDQDAALEFYVGKLGFEVGADADLGFMRWLTVHPSGQPDVNFILCDPTPIASPDGVERLKALIAEGLGGGPLLSTGDVQAVYEELVAKGVEFSGPPTDRGYGIDTDFADPFGNRIRIVQPAG